MKYKPDQIGAAFFERGEVLLDQRLRVAPCRPPGWPDAWPITSCMSVVSSPLNVPNFCARSASSGVHENSLRIVPGADLS